ncbi:hypothetical protein [Mucilaginibacter polytrichastri]|uniref:Uncharacterized protein n=1 Tax=Mucilaginibacter polytrichastri TaxID=1302689 RepID=A0A1Q5ZUB6_9SPHI|nr:hypothetical protein [Mucilaginibacter polytrichastri]OKS85355.1 hypothetical protein RG47T_0800 [Mucilaginibacter polytrichastri]SFS40224.1 hypothetical protein SAMN04487890_101293 [Mucilaginibacter polytrichastri]
MIYPISYKEIDPNIEFYSEVITLHHEAEQYLDSFIWCKAIKKSYLYTNIGKVFCIFLFEIENISSPKDCFLWVVVGDIPTIYLDTFGPKTTVEVLEDYVNLSQDWINHIKNGQSVNDCYPFNAKPTVELAELLEKKISFMRATLINNIEEIVFKIPS